MFRRAKISVLITLAGTLSVSAATLDVRQKNTAFQPGGAIKPAVLQPAQNAGSGANPLWSGVKVLRITPAAQAPVRVELGKVALAKATEAALQPGPVARAGGGK